MDYYYVLSRSKGNLEVRNVSAEQQEEQKIVRHQKKSKKGVSLKQKEHSRE